MNIPKLAKENITDPNARESFKQLQEFLVEETPLIGFRHFEISLDAATVNYRFPHSLGFLPKDIIETSVTGSGSVTYNFSLFDDTFLDITVTGPCVMRFFAGSYQKGST